MKKVLIDGLLLFFYLRNLTTFRSVKTSTVFNWKLPLPFSNYPNLKTSCLFRLIAQQLLLNNNTLWLNVVSIFRILICYWCFSYNNSRICTVYTFFWLYYHIYLRFITLSQYISSDLYFFHVSSFSCSYAFFNFASVIFHLLHFRDILSHSCIYLIFVVLSLSKSGFTSYFQFTNNIINLLVHNN